MGLNIPLPRGVLVSKAAMLLCWGVLRRWEAGLLSAESSRNRLLGLVNFFLLFEESWLSTLLFLFPALEFAKLLNFLRGALRWVFCVLWLIFD